MTTLLTHDRADYDARFKAERAVSYPAMDAVEASLGFALDRSRLEDAARVLACPVKANAPNWQHGRLIYAATRAYLHEKPVEAWRLVDIGTAKGFSALCLQWALMDHTGDSGVTGVTSIDVIDPASHTSRNTVAECDGRKTLFDVLEPWPEAHAIRFEHDAGLQWLQRSHDRLHVVYVDGKHVYEPVKAESQAIARRQEQGDLVIWDDLQVPGVARAVKEMADDYHQQEIEVLPHRQYAIGVRR